MSGVERTVRVGLMSFIDSDGANRVAMKGAVVSVHSDAVARFDRLNRLMGEPEPEPVSDPPKRRPGRPRKTVDDSVRND